MIAFRTCALALLLLLALSCNEQGGLLERKHIQEAEHLAEQLSEAEFTAAVAAAKKEGQRGWKELTFPVQTAKIDCPDRALRVRHDPYLDSLRLTVWKVGALDEDLRSVMVGGTYVYAVGEPFEGSKKIDHERSGEAKPSYTIDKLTKEHAKLFPQNSPVELPVVIETMAAVKKGKGKFRWQLFSHAGYQLSLYVFSEEMRRRIKVHKITAELVAAELHVLQRLLGKQAEALRGVDHPKVKQAVAQYDTRLESAESRKKELSELPFSAQKDALKLTVDPPCEKKKP